MAQANRLGREWSRVRQRKVVFPASLLKESSFRILLHLDDNGARLLTRLANDMQIELSTVSPLRPTVLADVVDV